MQLSTLPLSKPVRNHFTRCAELPWVKESGTTRPWALALQAIVTDGIGRVQGLFQVARFQPVQPLLGVVGPDAGVAVGLQLQADRQAGGTLGGDTPTPRRFHLARGTGEVLHVVADLVGDDVGAGEIAVGAEALLQFLEEGQIQVDLAIHRAIEGATGRGGAAATGLHLAVEQHQLGRLVLLAMGLEDARPGILGFAQHRAHEIHLLGIGRGDGLLLGGRALVTEADQGAEDLRRALAAEQAEHHHDGHAAQAQATTDFQAASAAGLFHVVATLSLVPLHGGRLVIVVIARTAGRAKNALPDMTTPATGAGVVGGAERGIRPRSDPA
ncbi:hypothetical protein Q3H58_004578 [Pseudomonas psychrotolerans]|nr:hypothetical protein [Pseudomonas psychrotolerans]